MKKMIIIANDIWVNSNEAWGFDMFADKGYSLEIWRVGHITIGTTIWEKTDEKYKTLIIEKMSELHKNILINAIYRPIYLFFVSGIQYFDREKAFIKILGGQYCNVSIGPLGSRFNHNRLIEVYGKEKSWMDHFPPLYNFLGAEIHKCALHSRREILSERNIIIHTYDYDCYLRNQDFKVDIEGKYILFYDQNFLEHKDQTNFGVRKWIPNERKYIEEITDFLEKIESYYKIPIVIAAHPTASTSNLKKVYGERRIVYGNTCGYTKNAEFVITFNSGAINYAVLYKKPILIWTCYQLKNTDLYLEWQHIKAKRLKANILDISKDVSSIGFEHYLTNPDNYTAYLKYVTGDVNDKRLFFEVVIEKLNGRGVKF